MKPRRLLILLALVLTGLLISVLPAALRASPRVPGLTETERTLLRIWVVSSPGGGQSWLTSHLRAFEKQHPGVTTHLRTVSAEEALAADAVLPDVILYMPGDFTNPSAIFAPVTADDALSEALLRCGCWQGQQMALPLCWGSWVMAIDGALEPENAATPAPTTLLGKPAATAATTTAPGYPLAAASQAACALQSPGGAALLSLSTMLPATERPPLPENFTQLSAADVYAAFRSRQCATAMITTGQAVAFTSLTSGGSGFPFRIMVPEEVITDQVWLASLTADAPDEAASLLAFLTAPEAQQALSSQGLHNVRDDLTLYTAGFSAEVEQAGQHALYAINAYIPREQVEATAWQAFQGTLSFAQALLPLV